jgi:hypothetical protein
MGEHATQKLFRETAFVALQFIQLLGPAAAVAFYSFSANRIVLSVS